MTSPDRCRRCGTRAGGANRFCAECGAELADPGGRPEGASSGAHDGERYAPLAAGGSGGCGPGPGTTAYRRSPSDWTGIEDLAEWPNRIVAFLITALLVPTVNIFPVLGQVVLLGLAIWTLVLYRRGRDIGAVIMNIRVVRENGDLAGFFHMWTREIAALLSFIVLGAGYWTAFFDPDRQTWHDRIMKTYVVQNDESLENRHGSSSTGAVVVFWISLSLLALALLLLAA